jgi:hypothetical protein
MNMHSPQPEEPLAPEFVVRMAAIWSRHGQDPDELASAMLAWAINQKLETADAQEVAALLFGLAAQIYPHEAAGHA